MYKLYVLVTILAAAANLYAASNDFRRVHWVVENMDRLGVPGSRLSTLGALKIAGGLGLLIGFAEPLVGIAAAAGLVLFFLAAMAFTLRVHWYAHLPVPAIWLLLAVGSLILRARV